MMLARSPGRRLADKTRSKLVRTKQKKKQRKKSLVTKGSLGFFMRLRLIAIAQLLQTEVRALCPTQYLSSIGVFIVKAGGFFQLNKTIGFLHHSVAIE